MQTVVEQASGHRGLRLREHGGLAGVLCVIDLLPDRQVPVIQRKNAVPGGGQGALVHRGTEGAGVEMESAGGGDPLR